MATHLGLGKALRVMRGEFSRSSVLSWRKESIVDVVVSFAMTTRAIPGVQGHLEAAHSVALKSPSNGGGIEAAITQLSKVTTLADSNSGTGAVSHESGSGSSTVGQESEGSEATSAAELHNDSLSGNSTGAFSGVVADAPTGSDHAMTSEDVPTSKRKAICRSLWRGRPCEDPASCDRAHKPLCTREVCKTGRNPECHDWHYRPKKNKSSFNQAPRSSVQGSGNFSRGRPAPMSNSAKTKHTRQMSQETERMYLKWKMSELKLKQTKLKAATYRDILVSNTPSAPTGLSRPQGQQAVASAPAQQPVGPTRVITSPPSPAAVNLGSIMVQLEAVVSALTAAGIMGNPN